LKQEPLSGGLSSEEDATIEVHTVRLGTLEVLSSAEFRLVDAVFDAPIAAVGRRRLCEEKILVHALHNIAHEMDFAKTRASVWPTV